MSARTDSGMVEYTVRAKEGELTVRSWTLAEGYAKEEAEVNGESRVEVRCPNGGGYIVKFVRETLGVDREYLPRDWEVNE